jgi:hypothetical protein
MLRSAMGGFTTRKAAITCAVAQISNYRIKAGRKAGGYFAELCGIVAEEYAKQPVSQEPTTAPAPAPAKLLTPKQASLLNAVKVLHAEHKRIEGLLLIDRDTRDRLVAERALLPFSANGEVRRISSRISDLQNQEERAYSRYMDACYALALLMGRDFEKACDSEGTPAYVEQYFNLKGCK